MLSRTARVNRRAGAAVFAASLFIVTTVGAGTAPGAGGGKKDKAPPSVAISSPAQGASLTGTTTVSGSASDNVGVAKVEVSVDGGSYQLALGTKSWSFALNTPAYANGSHTIAARATDTSGNASAVSVSVTFSNSASTPPPADTTPPAVSISLPSPGTTIAGTTSISGSASDNASVAKVEVSVDGSAYQLAQGTSSWSNSLNTTAYSNGNHTLMARATDTSGNATSASETINVSNSTSLPPGVTEQMVTPEGVTIQIYSGITGGWTCQKIYDLLRPNALELSRIGPSLTVKVQTQYATQTTAGAVQTNGVYGSYKATMYLKAASDANFNLVPDEAIAHEYGAVWSMYHLYISHQGDWTPYLTERGILNDPRLDSTLNWNRLEMIADDYRMLFGTSAAVSEMDYVNPDIPDPRTVAGLKDWFLNVYAVP
jgi:hypothetical protein